MIHMLPLLALGSDQVQLISWGVAVLCALMTVYFGYRARPIERLTLDLGVIETRNGFLEKRVSDLEDKTDEQRQTIDELNTKIALMAEENKATSTKLVAAETLIGDQRGQITDMKTQVINSQVTASLMRNQIAEIQKRFGIPSSLYEKRG